MVVRGAFEEGDRASWDICDRSGEAVFDTPFEPARVERVEIGVERCVALQVGQTGDRLATFAFPIRGIIMAADAYLVRCKMSVVVWIEAFAEKIADMSNNDEDDIREVG